MKQVLIAGGAGFIGRHLVNRLVREGHEVLVLDSLASGSFGWSTRVKWVQHDVTYELPSLSSWKFDEVYNFACVASPPRYQLNPRHTLMTSVLGTRNLLEVAESDGAKFLLTSTSEVYGDPGPENTPQVEEYRGNVNPIGPRACYDEGKRAAETLVMTSRVEAKIARLFNTYGPGMLADDGRLIPNFITQALRGGPLTIYGDGEQTRSFCYVDDTVEGLIRLMAEPRADKLPVNLGNPEERRVNEIAALVSRFTGGPHGIVYQPLPTDDPNRRCPNVARAVNLLEWRPTVNLEEGLRRTIDYFRSLRP